MTRKHFKLIAKAISELQMPNSCKMQVASKFASELRSTNVNFDRDRFMDACFPSKG